MIQLVKTSQHSQEWREMLINITAQMRLVMMPFVTPLVRAETDGAVHIGTGGYLENARRRLLLTNDHVVRDGTDRLTHTFFDTDLYFPIADFAREGPPTDLAAAPVDVTWPMTTHSAMAFPEHRVAPTHNPVEGEFLFVMGFAGKRAYYSPTLNIMLANGTPYLTQEYNPDVEDRAIKHRDYDPRYHFAMPWEPEKIDAVDEDKNKVPIDPHGFSGSLVWNTRFKEYGQANKSWEPGVASLTGIVWGWPTDNVVLFATRIEHVRTFLALEAWRTRG
jgi:hypothetical protein